MSDQIDDEYWKPDEYDLAVAGVTVAECESNDDAWFLAYLLKENGIKGVVLSSELKVALDDEEKARLVLARPVPAGKREEYDAESELEPEPLPKCPHCAAEDLVLEGVDDANHWLCGACGTKWDEVPTPASTN